MYMERGRERERERNWLTQVWGLLSLLVAGWRSGEELILQLKSEGSLEAKFFLAQLFFLKVFN